MHILGLWKLEATPVPRGSRGAVGVPLPAGGGEARGAPLGAREARRQRKARCLS